MKGMDMTEKIHMRRLFAIRGWGGSLDQRAV